MRLPAVAFCCLAGALWGAPPARFRDHTVTAELKFGYQLAAADVNGDGRADLIAVDERGTELAWFENPGWQRHVIAAGIPRPINIDCADLDGDGVPEIAILFRFESRPEKSEGIVMLLRHDGDVRGPWQRREIDRVPTAHRVRWADLDGKGRPVMVMAPMVGLAAQPPAFDAPVSVYLYRPGAWKRELVSDELRGVLHSIYPVDWDGDGRQELLTASFLGLRLLRPGRGGWQSREIARGAPEPCPHCGSSEVVRGRLGARPFLAAIEPWHGNEVVVYREREGTWHRKVLDESFQNGHALAVGDLDRDGRDEIIAGFRGQGGSVWIYRAEDADGNRWTRTALDEGGMAAASCAPAGSNLACIDNHRLKWYEGAPWGP